MGATVGKSKCSNCGMILMFSDTCTCPECSRWKEKILREVFIPIEDLELCESDEERNSILRTYGVPTDTREVEDVRMFRETDGKDGVTFKWKV